jgi:hypothetical protein
MVLTGFGAMLTDCDGDVSAIGFGGTLSICGTGVGSGNGCGGAFGWCAGVVMTIGFAGTFG